MGRSTNLINFGFFSEAENNLSNGVVRKLNRQKTTRILILKLTNMKKIALFLIVALCSVAASAQSIAKNELKQLQAFLAQPAAEAATNAEALRITDPKAPST